MLRRAAALGLVPDQFWRMTLREFELYSLGRGDEIERLIELASVHASWVINVWTKKKVKPTDLFRRRQDEADQDFVAEWRKLRGEPATQKNLTPEEQQKAFEEDMKRRAQERKRREFWESRGAGNG